MGNIIINISKFANIILMILYTTSCLKSFKDGEEREKNQRLNKQIIYVFLFHFLCYLTLAISNPDQIKEIMIFYGLQIFIATIYMYIYHYIYPYSSRMIANNMCFLMLIGYIMLTRLSFGLAKRQFIIATATLLLVSFIPAIMDRYKNLRNYGIYYRMGEKLDV